MSRPLPTAMIIGCLLAVGVVSASKIPYGMDEYSVAGAIQGEPIELVRFETIDIEVPATTQVVIEEKIST